MGEAKNYAYKSGMRVRVMRTRVMNVRVMNVRVMRTRVLISRSSPGPPEMESEIEIAFTFGESSHRNNRFLSLRAALKSIILNMGNLVPAIKRCLSVARAVARCERSLRANDEGKTLERHRQLFSLT